MSAPAASVARLTPAVVGPVALSVAQRRPARETVWFALIAVAVVGLQVGSLMQAADTLVSRLGG